MTVKPKSLFLALGLLMVTDLALAERWQLEKSMVSVKDASVAVTTLTVAEEDHGEQVALRVSCRADGAVSAGLRLSKPVEREDIYETSKGRYASVLVRFPKERETKVLLRSSLADKWLQFDDASTSLGDPEVEPLGLELWSVERLVRRLASSSRVTFRVSIEDSQDFQEGFNITGFTEMATPLIKECPKLSEWLRR
jgi:hypothetical protein